MNPWSLEGYRAVVTGGSSGIGRAIVIELRRHGAEVVNASWREPDDPLGVPTILADVSTPEGREQLVAALPNHWTALDILVNNVGTNIRKPTRDYTFDEFDLVQRTNTASMHELCRLLYPRLKQSGHASIVNIGSVAGLASVGSSAAYAMTKAAAAHLSRYLAVEWAKDGIRVNTVAPGWITTPLTTTIQSTPKAMAVIAERTPMGRMGHPEEVAAVAAFLCMPVASYLTGAVFPLDGGMSSNLMDITAALSEG